MICMALIAMMVSRQALAGEVGVTYFKTIGQTSPQLPLVTGGGRLSVDEQGNVYAGTPGQNSFLQKIASDGRLIWRDDNTHCAYTATAVDGEFVYGCGIGYYGYRHLLRRRKSSGVLAPGWKFVWTKPEDTPSGVCYFQNPSSLLVDDDYLYVLDSGTGELRRLDKVSGEEKAFSVPIRVADAVDIAFAKSGALLVLANSPAGTVATFDRKTGDSLNAQLIGGLGACATIAVEPKSGEIYLGEGGAIGAPVNKLRIFDASGKDTGRTIGSGGEWQGAWREDSFNFVSGTADIAFDPAGGFWSNGFGDRMSWLALMTHFSPSLQPDTVLLGATGYGLAVDDELNVTVGGSYKLSWNGDLLWSSGLVTTDPKHFPSTVSYWRVAPVYADAQNTILVNLDGSSIFALNAQTGENANRGYALKLPPSAIFVARAGASLFILGGGKVYRTAVELAPLQEVLALPEDIAKKNATGLAATADGSTLFVSHGTGAQARVTAYKNGTVIWDARAGVVLGCHKNVLFTAHPSGKGVLLMDATTGDVNGSFGRREIEDRPLVSNPTGMAFGSKDGKEYVFIACQSRILVYRIVTAS
jgi:hypothetical protein